MSPDEHGPGGKATASLPPRLTTRVGAAGSNLYTVILALALGVVVVTAVFVACKCYFQYNTIFKIP